MMVLLGEIEWGLALGRVSSLSLSLSLSLPLARSPSLTHPSWRLLFCFASLHLTHKSLSLSLFLSLSGLSVPPPPRYLIILRIDTGIAIVFRERRVIADVVSQLVKGAGRTLVTERGRR